jgi:hypothetical protein
VPGTQLACEAPPAVPGGYPVSPARRETAQGHLKRSRTWMVGRYTRERRLIRSSGTCNATRKGRGTVT